MEIDKLKSELQEKDEFVTNLRNKLVAARKECSRLRIKNRENERRKIVVMDDIYHHSTDNQRDTVFVKTTEEVARNCYPYWWGSTKAKRVHQL